jgi:hypothetical protein
VTESRNAALLNKILCTRRRQLTPVNLATQETEIRRTLAQGQPGQIIHESLGWNGSSGRIPAEEAREPEFKYQYSSKINKIFCK